MVSNITKDERKALNNLKEDDSHMVPYCRQGVALVVIDKDMYTENVWPYSMTKKCTKSARIKSSLFMPKYSNNFWIYKNAIGPKLKDHYIKLCHPGDNSPPARFYGLPKIHKASISFRPTVPACNTPTYKLAKFLTNIIQ